MMKIDQLKKKYSLSELFVFYDSKEEIIYNDQLKFNSKYVELNEKVFDLSDINYFFFDKVSYLKLNKAEMKGEAYDFSVIMNCDKNEEFEIKIFSSDDWTVIQDILRRLEIIVHTPNSLEMIK